VFRITPTHRVHEELTAFASALGLEIELRPVHRIPSVWTRGGLAEAPATWERLLLVVLSRPAIPNRTLSLIYGLGTLTDPVQEPCVEDVLWYLAADSEAVEFAQGSVDRWAQLRHYEGVDQATVDAFQQHTQVVCELILLLGKDPYQELLRIYRRPTV
jgi:hypothetical protein